MEGAHGTKMLILPILPACVSRFPTYQYIEEVRKSFAMGRPYILVRGEQPYSSINPQIMLKLLHTPIIPIEHVGNRSVSLIDYARRARYDIVIELLKGMKPDTDYLYYLVCGFRGNVEPTDTGYVYSISSVLMPSILVVPWSANNELTSILSRLFEYFVD